MNWIELHTNTCCSDTLSFLEPEQVISFAASSGCKAVAITDRNSVRAYWAAEQEAARKNIFLIYGLTIDCVDEEDRYAVTVLAKNEQGRRKLFSLIHLLDQNHFSFGRCVTRAQLDSHREGLLLGASAANGQLIRAIQLRYGERRLYQIAKAYDYIELPLLPYDAAAQLFPIAKVCQIPFVPCSTQRSEKITPVKNPMPFVRSLFLLAERIPPSHTGLPQNSTSRCDNSTPFPVKKTVSKTH